MRQLTLLDKIILQIDTGLATSFNAPLHNTRPCPGNATSPPDLNSVEKKHSAGLMRVNHAGEVCAQALYRGQAISARSPDVRAQMANSAREEIDHLAWCQERLTELNSHPSHLSFIWYTGSFLIGLIAGVAGDRWSLGFLAETEAQVSVHLKNHLKKISTVDQKSIDILNQMHEEELAHQRAAEKLGAAPLPNLVKKVMAWTSKIMTGVAYHL